MAHYQWLRLSRDGAAARVTLARPDALNALTPDLIAELHVALRDVAASDTRALVLAGEGRSFCAGVDLKLISAPDYSRERSERFVGEARAVVRLLETMPQATIARVHGHCFTGGLELVLGCDLIIAAEDAIFCDTHAKIGLQARWGMSARLPRRIGGQRARELSFTARRVPAREAEAIGLILKAVPLAELDAAIDAIIAQIVTNDPASIALYKAQYRAADNIGLDAGIDAEAAAPRLEPLA